MGGDPNPFKPETYLKPGELAQIDAMEAEVRERAKSGVKAFRDIIEAEGNQSITMTALLLESVLDPSVLSLYLAFFFLKEAQYPSAEPPGSDLFSG